MASLRAEGYVCPNKIKNILIGKWQFVLICIIIFIQDNVLHEGE